MNKIIKIFILYCLPILTIQSCGKQCRPQPVGDLETDSISQNQHSISQNQQPVSGITDAMCKKTKDYLLGLRLSPLTFFEQTIQEIRNGNPSAVNKKNPTPLYNNYTVLHYAIYSDNEELFNELLKLSPDLTQKDSSGMTILLVAIDRRKVNFVNVLLDRSDLATFIDEPNSFGTKPLKYAKDMESWSRTPQQKNDAKAITQALEAKGAV